MFILDNMLILLGLQPFYKASARFCCGYSEKDVLEFRKRRDQQRKESIERIAKEEVARGTYGDFLLPK